MRNLRRSFQGLVSSSGGDLEVAFVAVVVTVKPSRL